MINGYETEEHVRAYIQALLREKEQQEAVGNEEAVKACEEQLRAFGYKGLKPAARAERRPSVKAEKRG